MVAWLDESDVERHRIGGKAASLNRLASFGFRIPPGFCLTTDAFALQAGSTAGQRGPPIGPACAARRADARRPGRGDGRRSPRAERRRGAGGAARTPCGRRSRRGRWAAPARRPVVRRGRGRDGGAVRRAARHRTGADGRRGRGRRAALLGVALERARDRLPGASRAGPRWRRDGGRRPGARSGRCRGHRLHPPPGQRPDGSAAHQRGARSRRGDGLGHGHARHDRRRQGDRAVVEFTPGDSGGGPVARAATSARAGRRLCSRSSGRSARRSTSRLPTPPTAGISSRRDRSRRPHDDDRQRVPDRAGPIRPTRRSPGNGTTCTCPRPCRRSPGTTSDVIATGMAYGYQRLGTPGRDPDQSLERVCLLRARDRCPRGGAGRDVGAPDGGGRARRASRRPHAYWRDVAVPELSAAYAWVAARPVETMPAGELAETWDEVWARIGRCWSIHFYAIRGPYQVLEDLADLYESVIEAPTPGEALALIGGGDRRAAGGRAGPRGAGERSSHGRRGSPSAWPSPA